MSVRNLRAMFENKTQDSPPDRGRSPGGTESPRPLSKVRTSFVAIEKDGRVGLQQRDPSEASSVSRRKLSQDTEAGSSVHPDNISTIASSTTTTSQAEPPKETASLAPDDPPKGLAASPQIKEDPRARKSDFGGHSLKSQEAVGPAPPNGEQEKKANGVKAVGAMGTPARSTPAASETPAKPAGDDVKKVNGVNAAETSAKSTPAKSTPAASARPAVAAVPEKAPTAKHSTGPSKPAAVSAAPTRKVTDKELVMSPDQVPQPRAATRPANHHTTTTSHPPTTPKAARASTTEKKAAPASASPGGFVKPRPKSPTRPVRLPASLTTHTTASGSRSRVPSGSSAPPAPPHDNSSARSASRAKALGRSSSAAGRQRPSLGPPPKQPAKDHPVAKRDAKVDEGFLARMMRPTQASASKKNEKAPVTPPRRPGQAAGVARKPASAKSVPAAKRSASKTTSATTSAAPSPERVVVRKPSAADRDIANAAVAVEETPAAEHDEPEEAPRTPEREATIAEELEEDNNRPGEAGGLANGNHHEAEAEAEGPTPVDIPEGNGKAADVGVLNDEETW